MKTKKLWLSILLSLIFLTVLSCSLELKNSGDIKLSLPSYKTSRNFTQTYEIILTNSANEELKYTTSDTYYVIYALPIGEYSITITTTTPTGKLFGKSNITIKSGLNEATVKLEKVSENIGKQPVSIEVAPKNSEYVLYYDKININQFNITEHYADGTKEVVSDYSSYSISPTTNIKTIGPTSVTITHTNGVHNTASIDCKFNLQQPSVTLKDSGSINLQKGDAKTVSATILYASSMPSNSYTEKYEWLKVNDKSGYTVVKQDSTTFTIPSDTVGTSKYKFKVTTTTNPDAVKYCIDGAKTYEQSSSEITVTVEDTSGGDSGVTATVVKTFTELQNALKTSDNIEIGSNIQMTASIPISNTKTITASSPYTLSRGTNFTGAMFTISTGATLNLGTSTSKTITLDGFSLDGTGDSLIVCNSSSTLNGENIKLQGNNEYSRGGGAIYNDTGTVNLKNSTVTSNTSTSIGGGIYNKGGTLNLTEVTVTKNTSNASGGGIASTMSTAKVTINNTTAQISENKITGQSSLNGGGFCLNGGSLKIENGTIETNTSDSGPNNLFAKAKTTVNGQTVSSDTTYDQTVDKNTNIP